MTYIPASPILGVGKSSAAQIDRFFEVRGRSYAGNDYQPAPAGLGQMIRDASRRWQQSVNHDLLAAQIVHEAAAWQSEYARERNNPSGLGAVNHDPDQAIRFASPQDGIRATVAHLLTYISGPGPWTEHDPRAEATPADWQGSVKLLRELEQKWAFTPWEKYNATPVEKRYGARIAQIANLLVATEVDNVPDATFPKPSMIPFPSPNKDGYSQPRKVEAICNHIATATKASNLSWLTSPSSSASCNAYIDKQGQIYELVPYGSSPWTNGVVNRPDRSNPLIRRWVEGGINPNTRTYTIEHEGNPGDDLTDAQIASNNKVTAWVASKAGFPISRVHVIGHYQIDSVDRSHCPSFSDAEWKRLVAGARNLLDGAVTEPPPSVPKLPQAAPEPNWDQNPWGKFWVPLPFLAEIDQHDWFLTGWATSEAFLEGDKVVQYFERARLEIDAQNNVTRGLVGYEALIARHPERAA